MLTVTDAEEAVLRESTTFSSITLRVAQLLGVLCDIKTFPNFPIDPLLDPPRDLAVRPLLREELRTLHDLGKQLVSLSEELLRSG